MKELLNFKHYSHTHIHFFDDNIPELVVKMLDNNNSFSIIDIGCGDGRFFYFLKNRGYFGRTKRIVGVDLSEKRLSRVKKLFPEVETMLSDVCNLSEVSNSSFDFVISSQVIEHVNDDNKMIKEIKRILKTGGKTYISSVIKKKYGFYIYRKNGDFVLDPTHVKEYKSEKEFFRLFERNNLKILYTNKKRVKFPVIDLFVRFMIKINFLDPENTNFMNNEIVRWVRNRIKIPIIGYSNIEVVCEK